MDIQKARELIGKTNSKYTDTQIQDMIDTAKLFSDIAIDMFMKMTPEDRKKLLKKGNNLRKNDKIHI
jgi:hypothetical protein